MNISERLSLLRKEKNRSQKEAAYELGISQALLSHYENGIRECRLDFVAKACDYYDVSADYLLGLSENRKAFDDIYINTELSTDSRIKSKLFFVRSQKRMTGYPVPDQNMNRRSRTF